MKKISKADLTEIIEKRTFMTSIFDDIRLIESGGSCELCKLQKSGIEHVGKKCHTYWNRDSKCANCVSKKAGQAEHKLVKLEYYNENYYFVIAEPVIVEEQKYIIEFITNITTQLTVQEEGERNGFVNDLMKELETISSREAFTGLYNKKYLENDMNKRLESGCQAPFYIGMFDIDRFKEINDQYGHMTGDEVLLRMANIMKELFTDDKEYAARFGGDEFVVVFTNEDYNVCMEKLTEVQRKFSTSVFQTGTGEICCSASFGIADISSAQSFTEAIHMVDKRLYESKKNRDNR